MAHLAQESDLVHSVFPNDCLVSVFDKGPTHCRIQITGAHAGYDRIFLERIVRDRDSRRRFVPHPQFDIHTDTHSRYLDKAFKESFGMGYGEFIAAIRAVINVNGSQPATAPNTSLFIHQAKVFCELAKSGRPLPSIERAINGFSISASNLLEEERVIWKPKQENRAYRRGFFIFPHKSGLHLAFSRAMAQENLIQLATGVSYKHLPKEWQTPATMAALGNLSHASGDWFERLICKHFAELGFSGHSVNTNIGFGQSRLQIPDHVGEIDFLGYHPQQKLLVVIEAKMVMVGLEPRYWRDDLDEFVFDSSSYAAHFRKKLAWVNDNASAIASLLGYNSVNKVAGAMITLYPCIARGFIADFPCVSISEFMLDYERAGSWPYHECQKQGLTPSS